MGVRSHPGDENCIDAVNATKAIGLYTDYGADWYSDIRADLETASMVTDSIDQSLAVIEICDAWCVEAMHGDREGAIALLDSLYDAKVEEKAENGLLSFILATMAEVESYPPQGGTSAMSTGDLAAVALRARIGLHNVMGALMQNAPQESQVDAQELASQQPLRFAIRGCYPNPFNPVTTVEIVMSREADLALEAYNIKGQRVRVLHDGFMTSGTHRIPFDAGELSSGLYFIQARSGSSTLVEKVMLVR